MGEDDIVHYKYTEEETKNQYIRRLRLSSPVMAGTKFYEQRSH